MSWTGSESQRRPQLICLPPSRPPIRITRFIIPVNTTRELGFERYESYSDLYYTFRDKGWFLVVHRSKVIHREDNY